MLSLDHRPDNQADRTTDHPMWGLLRPTSRQPPATTVTGWPSDLPASCLCLVDPTTGPVWGLDHLTLSNFVTCQLSISAPAHNLQPAGHTMQLTLQLSQDPSEVPANCLTISRKQAACLFVTSGMSLVKGILGCLFAPGQQHV